MNVDKSAHTRRANDGMLSWCMRRPIRTNTHCCPSTRDSYHTSTDTCMFELSPLPASIIRRRLGICQKRACTANMRGLPIRGQKAQEREQWRVKTRKENTVCEMQTQRITRKREAMTRAAFRCWTECGKDGEHTHTRTHTRNLY